MLLSLLTLVFTISCTKKGSQRSQIHPTPSTSTQQKHKKESTTTETKTREKNIIVLGEAKQPSKKETTKLNTTYITTGINFLKDKTGDFITPKDFKIGTLQKKFNLNKTTYEQYLAVERFLKSLTRGKIDIDTIQPTERENLTKLIKYHLKIGQIPLSYRIGEITTDKNNTVTTNIRLTGKNGTTEGQIYITGEDDDWFIRDIQIDFEQLTSKSTPQKNKNGGKTPFNPSTFEWMLKNNE